MIRILRSSLVFASLSLALAAQAADPIAGTATVVVGTVSSMGPNGVSRLLSRGDAVYSGDRILTGAAASVRVEFRDGSSAVLRPNTEFAVETFRFGTDSDAAPVIASAPRQVAAPPPGSSQAVLRLVRGGFRTITGLIGKVNRQEYRVHTPVATIGIRGTEYLVVTCDAVCAADSVVQSALPAGETALGGTISAVDQGGVVITSISGRVANLDAAQFLLTTASGAQYSLTALPGFLLGETWLANQAAAAQSVAGPGQPAAVTGGLEATSVSTIPVAASVAVVVATGVIAAAADSGSDDSLQAPVVTAPTSTAR